MKIKKGKTERGFAILHFEDRGGLGCSLQKSSAAEEDCIWLGITKVHAQILASETPKGGTGWVDYPIPENVMVDTRMHLSQEQVKALLPHLQKFVETGELS